MKKISKRGSRDKSLTPDSSSSSSSSDSDSVSSSSVSPSSSSDSEDETKAASLSFDFPANFSAARAKTVTSQLHESKRGVNVKGKAGTERDSQTVFFLREVFTNSLSVRDFMFRQPMRTSRNKDEGLMLGELLDQMIAEQFTRHGCFQLAALNLLSIEMVVRKLQGLLIADRNSGVEGVRQAKVILRQVFTMDQAAGLSTATMRSVHKETKGQSLLEGSDDSDGQAEDGEEAAAGAGGGRRKKRGKKKVGGGIGGN